MEILKYEKSKKSYYNVFLDSGEVLTLDERVITENELLLTKNIDINLYHKLIFDNRVYELIDLATGYIEVRLRSISEMREYLKKKEDNLDIINKAIDRLISLGYLDDDHFTKAYIKDKLAFTSFGDYKIRMELQRLGIDNNIIENNLYLIDDDILDKKMRKIIERDLRANKKYKGLSLKSKIYNHLLSSGFSKEKVIPVINEYSF